jgi:hypothetical protein
MRQQKVKNKSQCGMQAGSSLQFAGYLDLSLRRLQLSGELAWWRHSTLPREYWCRIMLPRSSLPQGPALLPSFLPHHPKIVAILLTLTNRL